MNSLEIRELQQQIIGQFNRAALPMEVKRLIMAEIMVQIDNAAAQEINMLIKEKEKQEGNEPDE